jgi:Ca2+-binding RTX toxin-like protein
MSKYVKNQDSNVTWTIDESGENWTLKKDATITVFGDTIEVLESSKGNRLNVFGDLDANGALARGINVAGDDTEINIGKASRIDAWTGIRNEAEGLRVMNHGDIVGNAQGILSTTAAAIRSDGDISGERGIETYGGSVVKNLAGGEIIGNSIGVLIEGGYDSRVINHGLISGADAAVTITSLGDNLFRNTGTISGDLYFGGGRDTIDVRKGFVDGVINGGDGHDIYKVSSYDTEISEILGFGTDRVYATSSFSLGENIENLFLIGKADGSGWGNDDDNVVMGNKGDNTLAGGAGDDFLGGGKGDDTMNGDEGEDMFVFKRGDAHDRITGFEDGIDQIYLPEFKKFDSFEDLEGRISQHGADVWISLGQGDRLVIMNTDIGTIDENDFSFQLTSAA